MTARGAAVRRWAAPAVLALSLGSLVAPAAPAAAVSTVTVDGTRPAQTVTGFGVNVNAHAWEGGALRPALDQLTDQMGARVVRVIIEKADWEATNDNADPQVFNDAYFNAVLSTPRFTDLWSTIGYLDAKGVTVSLAVMGAGPAWLGGSDLNPGAEAEYAETVAALVRHARQVKGLRVGLVEPFNELDWDGKEGIRATPQQAVLTMELLGRRLDALGLGDVRFIAPDTASVTTGVGSYLNPLLTNSYVAGKIAHLGLHDYSGSSGNARAALAASPRPATDFWLTEFSAWCTGCDSGAPNPGDWPFARQTGQYLLRHVADGAAGALVWDGVDSFYEHHGSVTYWGLLAGGGGRGAYQPRKTFAVMAQVMRYVPVGSQVLPVASDDPDVALTAFRDPVGGRLTLVGFNVSGGAKTVGVQLSGLTGYQSFDVVQTNAAASLAAAGTVSATGGRLEVTVPGDTMVTVTGLGTSQVATVLPSPDAGVAELMSALATRIPTLSVVASNPQAGTFSVPGCPTTTSPLPAGDEDRISMLAGGTYRDSLGRTAGPLAAACRPAAVSVTTRP